MPAIYVCRKCGKNHSIAEFDRSRFCKVCGSLIIREYRAIRSLKTSEEKTKDAIGLRRAAESLRKRIEDTHEYEVISEQKGRTKPESLLNQIEVEKMSLSNVKEIVGNLQIGKKDLLL